MKAVIFVILSIFYLSAVAYGAVGEIEKIEGNVFYREHSGIPYKKATAGLLLNSGYWIKTESKSWTNIKLIDGSRFILSDNTELEISDYLFDRGRKSGVFYVTQGKIRATVLKLTGQTTNFRVKTPTAVAGIKGTEFMMLAKGQANVFFGNENTVYVSGYNTVEKTLTADTMVQNTRGLTPTEPVKVEEGTLLYDAKIGLSQITGAAPPKEWEISGELPHIIARWNINYGHYLADAGRYEEALYVFQIALDLSDNSEIRADARLERGAVYSRFLRNPEAALSEYLLILEEYPETPQKETALYLTAMTLYELKFKKQAKQRLTQYKKEYPDGKYLTNIETILKLLDDEK
ncbi:FecR domain-containing protein [Thermodesulfovibrio sp. 3907-1M]|uniref:FecR domain-containing protein n=1 Tax=Thermodesulfovibrio autotrophicus TaxID=3118333 RepID=A0AAU8GVT4_9BACT